MTGSGRRDLSGLHRQIVLAKGGNFGAVQVSPEKPSPAQRAFYLLLSCPGLGPAVQRAVAMVRRGRSTR